MDAQPGTYQKRTGKFNTGVNRGSAVCVECGTRRQRGNGEQINELFYCQTCYDRAGDDNAIADGQMTEEQFVTLYGVHSTWYES